MTSTEEAQFLALSQMMRDLRASHPWAVFVQEMKGVEGQLIEQLIQSSPGDVRQDALRGEILGIRRILDYPNRVIHAASQRETPERG